MRCFMITRCCRSCTGYQWSSASPTNWPSSPTRHVRHLCRNISVDTSRHEVARGHCDRRPHHCCMSHSDKLSSANALSALQHHLSGTLSLSPFRTVTSLHYLNLDLKHICSPPSMLLNCPDGQCLWSHGNMALYKFCIVLYEISWQQWRWNWPSHRKTTQSDHERNQGTKAWPGKIWYQNNFRWCTCQQQPNYVKVDVKIIFKTRWKSSSCNDRKHGYMCSHQ